MGKVPHTPPCSCQQARFFEVTVALIPVGGYPDFTVWPFNAAACEKQATAARCTTKTNVAVHCRMDEIPRGRLGHYNAKNGRKSDSGFEFVSDQTLEHTTCGQAVQLGHKTCGRRIIMGISSCEVGPPLYDERQREHCFLRAREATTSLGRRLEEISECTFSMFFELARCCCNRARMVRQRRTIH